MSVCSFIPFGIENPPKFKTISEQTVDRNSAVELLKKFDCLRGLPESDQVSFFDMI